MGRKVRGKWSGWLWVACALAPACEGDKPAPGVEFDPNLVEDGGAEQQPPPPPAGGGGRADAGEDASPQDAAADASNAGKDAGKADAAPPDDGGESPAEPGSLDNAERLLIADGLEQRLYAYDVPSRRLLESYMTGARVRVYAGPSGRYGYALPSVGTLVDIVDMGFVQSAGGKRELEPIAQVEVGLMGAGPASLLAQSDQVALFFDGEAKLAVLRESSLAGAQAAFEVRAFVTGPPHHGLGLPFDGGYVATRLAEGTPALGSFDERGVLDASVSFDCAAPEGAALAGGTLAIGCEQGLLRVEPGGAARTIAYPEGAQRARRLVGHPSDALYLTVLGDRLCALGADALSCEALAQPVLDFGFDAGGKRALALLSDGTLHVFDAESLQALGALRVTSGVSSSDPLLQPQLASGRRITYVSDPQASSVHMVDPAQLTLAGRIELPGAPASLAVFRFRAAN